MLKSQTNWKRFIGKHAQELHIFLMHNGFTSISGSPTELIYQTSAKNRDIRRVLMVDIKSTIVKHIYFQVEVPDPKNSWNPTITKRTLAKEVSSMSLSKLAIEMRKRLEIASIEDYLEVNEDPITSRLLFETTRANAILDKNKDKVFMQHLNITNRTMAEKASLAYDVPYFLALPISLEAVGELVSALKDACKSYKCTPPRSWDDVINGIHNTTNTKEFIENEDEPRFAPEL